MDYNQYVIDHDLYAKFVLTVWDDLLGALEVLLPTEVEAIEHHGFDYDLNEEGYNIASDTCKCIPKSVHTPELPLVTNLVAAVFAHYVRNYEPAD